MPSELRKYCAVLQIAAYELDFAGDPFQIVFA